MSGWKGFNYLKSKYKISSCGFLLDEGFYVQGFYCICYFTFYLFAFICEFVVLPQFLMMDFVLLHISSYNQVLMNMIKIWPK